MLQYLVILLSKDSVSYCHYNAVFSDSNVADSDKQPETPENNLISKEDLKAGILFAMKENLNIQFVYPKKELPQDYKDIIHTIDHTDIRHISAKSNPAAKESEQMDVLLQDTVWIADSIKEFTQSNLTDKKVVVIRCNKEELLSHFRKISCEETEISCEEMAVPCEEIFGINEKTSLERINIVIKDIDTFTENDFAEYKSVLCKISSALERFYKQGKFLQINILTDRIMLDSMNNCNAGDNNLTLAPDGRFYICPAFYYSGEKAVGDLHMGIDVKNPQLYRLEYAPLCRECDSYHCKRCVWLNKKTTLEVNTPSHEQCVVSHLERNASREFLLRTKIFDREIKDIDYLDPFDVRKQW